MHQQQLLRRFTAQGCQPFSKRCSNLLYPHHSSSARHHATRFVAAAAATNPRQQPAADDPGSNPGTTGATGSSNPTSGSSNPTSSRGPDRPDMADRRRRRRPAPRTRKPSSSSSSSSRPSSSSSFGSGTAPPPDSQGWQERALLMAFLDSLDPDMRQQFTQFMGQQLEGMQQEEQDRAARESMQAVINAAAQSDDPAAFLQSKQGRDIVFDSVRAQFSPQEAELLDQFFGDDWGAAFGGANNNKPPLSGAMLHKLTTLTPEQQAMLANIMSKTEQLNKQADVLQQRTQAEGGESSTTSTSTSTSSGAGSNGSNSSSSGAGSSTSTSSSSSSWKSSSRGPPKQSSWGASFRKSKNERLGRSGNTSSSSSSSSSSSVTREAEQYWDKLLDKDMTGRLQKMMQLAAQASKGQLQFGLPPSRHFMALKRNHQRMLQVEMAIAYDRENLQEDDVILAYRAIDEEMNSIVYDDRDALDHPTRSVLLYMDALFLQGKYDADGGHVTDVSDDEEEDEEDEEEHVAATAAGLPGGSSSSSSADWQQREQRRQQQREQRQQQQREQRRQQQEQEEYEEAERQGWVNLEKLQKLSRFIKAAENLPAFQAWLHVFSENHPHLATSDMLQLDALGGDDWFITPHLRDSAFEAAKAALDKAQAATAAAAAAAAAAAGLPPDAVNAAELDSFPAAKAMSAALAPFIDEEQVELLAVMDADTLWFLAELEGNDFSEEVLMKWSLHPEVGPRLTSGKWLSGDDEGAGGLSEPLRRLYAQAQVPDFMSALNFDIPGR